MELRHLRYFVTVAQERNFIRSAEKLCIAQPPLSRQIHDLEAELGTALLDRDCRPVRLTEAERLFYEHATQVLERIDDLRTMMRRFRDAERPRYVIGFVASTIYAVLPNLIRRLQAATPGLDVSLRDGEPRADHRPEGSMSAPAAYGSTIRRCGATSCERSGLWSPYP